ncbi:MAG TPA: hypothetical protein ENJ56_03375, partial [Anaerolineae bacterium]|nr:hypothetical protein [Anaerolineae bacterium]
MATVKLIFLGHPTIQKLNTPLQHALPDKVIALLAYLALARMAQRREHLATLLWGNKPDTRARNNLSIALNKVKKEFQLTGVTDQFLRVTRREVALVSSVSALCDVIRFETLAAFPERQTLAQLEEAAGLYRGAFLQGFRPSDEVGCSQFLDWAQQQAARLEQMAIKLFTTLINRHQKQGNLANAIYYAERLLAIDPWQENVYRQLMQLSAENGQRDQAIAYYHACYKILQAELEIEPDAETKALFEAIRTNRLNGKITLLSRGADAADLYAQLPLRPYDNIIGRQSAMA